MQLNFTQGVDSLRLDHPNRFSHTPSLTGSSTVQFGSPLNPKPIEFNVSSPFIHIAPKVESGISFGERLKNLGIDIVKLPDSISSALGSKEPIFIVIWRTQNDSGFFVLPSTPMAQPGNHHHHQPAPLPWHVVPGAPNLPGHSGNEFNSILPPQPNASSFIQPCAICSGGGVHTGLHGGGGVTVRKPVIYLYPTVETKVEVKVTLPSDSEFVSVYPSFRDGTWSVLAKPDGSLTRNDDSRTYRQLFWEAQTESGFTLDTKNAFCVKGSQTASFLEESLTKLSLSESEINDFIIYWLPYMEHNSYNAIQFLTNEYTDRFPLDISPVPQSLIRVFMIFEAVCEPFFGTHAELTGATRQGFTAVEWGGAEINSIDSATRNRIK